MSAIPRDFSSQRSPEADIALLRNLGVNNNQPPVAADMNGNPVLWYQPLRFPIVQSSAVFQNAPPGAGNLERDEAMRALGLNEGDMRYKWDGKYAPFPDPNSSFLNAYPNNYPNGMPPANFLSYPASGMQDVGMDQRNGQDPLMMVLPNGMHAPFRGFQDPRLPDNNNTSNGVPALAPQDYSRGAQPIKRRAPGSSEDRHVKKRSQGKDQMNNIMGEILGDARGIKEAARPGAQPDIILQPPRPVRNRRLGSVSSPLTSRGLRAYVA